MKGDTSATSEKAVPAGVAMRCPRCDSANTKFCYYNNYSLSQPRHFCKTCRRYWTRGGALRNVPIGGGCRKSKKLIKPSISPADVIASGLFPSPAMDFHRQFPPPWLAAPDLGGAIQQIMSTTTNNNPGLASTIESLSCMNQDLHWKLQQQRLSLLFSKDHHNVNVPEDSSFAAVPDLVQEPSSEVHGGDVAAPGWFSGNSYYASHMATAAGGGSTGNDVGTTTTVSNWNINNGSEAWSHDNHHFSTA